MNVPDGAGAVRLCWTCAGVEPTAEGERAATFQAVVADALPQLRRWALRLTRDASEADDVIQDALIKAMEAWPSFEQRTAHETAAWLRRITRNAFLDLTRKRKRSPVAEVSEERETAAQVSGVAEYLDALRGLDMLGDDQRAVMELAIAGESYHDIAAKLEIPIGTVMSRLYRARRSLEIMLG